MITEKIEKPAREVLVTETLKSQNKKKISTEVEIFNHLNFTYRMIQNHQNLAVGIPHISPIAKD